MNLALWQDVYCLLFLLSSYILFSKKKKILGIILYTYSFFGIIIGDTIWRYILLIRLFSAYTKILGKNFPSIFSRRKSSWIIIIASLISPLISTFQSVLLSLSKYQLTNSNALYRIGINSASNIHHGGWIAAYQFLEGIEQAYV